MHPPASPRIVNLVLILAAIGLVGTGIFGWAWYRSVHQPLDPDRLSAAQRQALVAEMMNRSPGAYIPAWFAPEIGYVLRQGEITAWNDTFVPNRLGYRTYPPRKPPGTFRIVFVGDSWTYGMGVREEDTFAQQLEQLANAHSGSTQRIQSWVLALPSYNTPNQIAALRYFFDQVQPDAVVLCPVQNDANNTARVLPNGATTHAASSPDDFGDDLSLNFPYLMPDSYLQRIRWRMAFAQLKDLEVELQQRGIPFLLFFTAIWEESWLHQQVQEAGLEAPYLILPQQLASSKWRNPPPIGHPTPAAHRMHAMVVYQGLADLLGWSALPQVPPPVRSPVYRGPVPLDTARLTQTRNIFRNRIPATYRVPLEHRRQITGPLDLQSGLMGRMTALWLRRLPGRTQVAVTVAPLAEAPSLYPLALTLGIPAASGGTTRTVRVQTQGRQTFTVPLPQSVADGEVFDLVLQSARIAYVPGRFTPGAVYVQEVVQQ